MHRSKMLQSKHITSIVSIFIITVLASFANAFAQNTADTAKQVFFAAAHTKLSTYIIKQPNVIFPEILKGNEAFATDYIADYSYNKKKYLVTMFAKSKNMLPKAKLILKKYHLPEELSTLIILESECKADAESGAGAVGYWQIMDVVAKEYGLSYVKHLNVAERKKLNRLDAKRAALLFKKMSLQKDDRKNFSKSTQAAARYLHERRENLNDNWLLIVASYNCGEGKVRRAIKKSGKIAPDFWAIKKFLPLETQNYVMNFIALNVIYQNYDNFIKDNLIFTPLKISLPTNFDQINSDESEEVTNGSE